jgi:ketosteroid isomerase-like protein
MTQFNNMENTQIIQQMYKDFGTGNMQAVLANFDNDVVWIRPGEPGIPFAGTFIGIPGLAKMFGIISKTIRIKDFHPRQILGNGDTVVVIGADEADVIDTGKSYLSEWVYVYTFRDKKITHVQVYLDSLLLSEAFKC